MYELGARRLRLQSAAPHRSEWVSEIDLADAHDRVVLGIVDYGEARTIVPVRGERRAGGGSAEPRR
jgi:hypothetical protein